MKVLKYLATSLALIALVLIFVAPVGPLPGFFIGGTETPVPERWPDTSAIDEIKLRVPGSPPRVVTIWVVDYEGDLYIVGAPESGWVSMLGNGGPVKLRIGDSTYPVTASRIEEGWRPILTAYIEKYRTDYPDIVAGFPPADQAEGQFTLFQLN